MSRVPGEVKEVGCPFIGGVEFPQDPFSGRLKRAELAFEQGLCKVCKGFLEGVKGQCGNYA